MTTLTLEQQQALEQLLASRPAQSDWLQDWLGVSGAQLKSGLAALRAGRLGLEEKVLAWAAGNPLEAITQFIAGASLAFYLAEKGVNPKIKTYVDAFYYISTCASVGYADIFAVTQTGRTIAAGVMLVGPALAARSLDRGETT